MYDSQPVFLNGSACLGKGVLGHESHGGGVQANLPSAEEQALDGDRLGVGADAAGGPLGYALHMQHLSCACSGMCQDSGDCSAVPGR